MSNNDNDFDKKMICMFKTAFFAILCLVFGITGFIIWVLITLIQWVTTK